MSTALVLLLAACHRPDPADSAVDDSVAPADPGRLDLGDLSGKNLVFLHVDTLRQDHFPQYGYARNTLPTVSQRDWLVVDGMYGGSSWTMPSTGALFSSSPPDLNGLTDDGDKAGSAHLSLRVPSVTNDLHALGWATALYTGNPWLVTFTDMGQGFDVATVTRKDTHRYNLDKLLDDALAWVDGVPTDQPFFLFLQPMDMHMPYWVDPKDRNHWGEADPPFDLEETDDHAQAQQILLALADDPEGVTQAINDVYDEEMLGLDRGITRLLDALAASGRLDNTVVILSADHGEMLNDEGGGDLGHGGELRQELLANPFLVLMPDGQAGEVTCIAPNEDVFPTLLDAIGLPPREGVDGVSLTEGCPGLAVSQLWSDETKLDVLSVTDDRVRIERSCRENAEVGWDLVADPLQASPQPPARLDPTGALRAALEAAWTRIEPAYPDSHCALE